MKCTCFHDSLTPDLIERYVLEDDTVWVIYKPCPIHNFQAKEPVWKPEYGALDKEETAAVEAAALMRA